MRERLQVDRLLVAEGGIKACFSEAGYRDDVAKARAFITLFQNSCMIFDSVSSGSNSLGRPGWST